MSEEYFLVKEHIIQGQHIREYPRATANSQETPLQLAVKHYRPLDNLEPQAGDVTIIGAHANGFPKELYEPLWDELLARSKSSGFQIRGIWIMDVAQQGKSGVLNEHELGDDPSWFDGARDMLHMVNTFRADILRPIIGIGHSMGANHLINLSIMHPRLLTTLILMEPVVQRLTADKSSLLTPHITTRMSTFRRDMWPSIEAAKASFKKNKYYAQWDPRVLKLWVKFGLRELPTAIYPDSTGRRSGNERPVTLTTTKHQEVFTFQRPNFPSSYPDGTPRTINKLTHPDLAEHEITYPSYRAEMTTTVDRLPFVRPSVLYIFGGSSMIFSNDNKDQKVNTTGIGLGGSGGTKEDRVKDIVLPNVGHLVAMEAVDACADATAEWTGRELSRWRQEEAQFNREWNKVSKIEKVTMKEEWKEMMTDEGWRRAIEKGGLLSKL